MQGKDGRVGIGFGNREMGWARMPGRKNFKPIITLKMPLKSGN